MERQTERPLVEMENCLTAGGRKITCQRVQIRAGQSKAFHQEVSAAHPDLLLQPQPRLFPLRCLGVVLFLSPSPKYIYSRLANKKTL